MVKISNPGPFRIVYRIFYAIYRRWEALVTKAKYMAYYPQFKRLGDNVRLETRVSFNKPENISIGDETFIGQDSLSRSEFIKPGEILSQRTAG
jgi:acetyltransferase-like isoleucine patch superfamily enzyme